MQDEATAFRSEADNVAIGSKLVGFASHYNRQRHQCVVDVTSSRSENGGTYSKEQIFDPKMERSLLRATGFPMQAKQAP